jgi:hypothetical protein
MELVVSVDVDAPADQVFAAATDWARQGEWMLATHVTGGTGPGARIDAVTGWRGLGVRDEMRAVVWTDRLVVVEHLGRVVRGSGLFEVTPLDSARSRFTWAEWVTPPLGAAGALVAAVVAPVVRAGLARSLRAFAEYAREYRPAPAAPIAPETRAPIAPET